MGMKRKCRKYGSIALASVLVCLAVLSPVSAANTKTTSPADKIDSVLQEKLDSMNDDDTIDVSVWLRDIDYEDVEQEVTQKLEQKVENGKISRQALLLPEDDLKTMKQQSSGNYQLSTASLQPVEGLDIEQLSSEDTQEFIETKREVTSQEYQRQNAQIFGSLFPKEKQSWFRTVPQEQPEVIYSCKYAPNIMMTLTKSQIEEIAQSADVEEIYYYTNKIDPEDLPEEEPLTLEASPQTVAASNISLSYQTSTGVSNMRIYNHADGTGIKLGQIELGIPNVNSTVFQHMIDNGNPENSKLKILFDGQYISSNDHAWAVATLMVGKTDTFTSIVPNAQLYCAGVYDNISKKYVWKQSLELLVDAGVNVINSSTSNLYSGEVGGTYGDSSKWIDHLIYSHNVTICMASGNDRYPLRGTMAYNAITVGNINDNHTVILSDDIREVETEIKQSAYSTNGMLAYKPDIMAPGETAGSPVDPQIGYHHGGTSYAAPIVSGAAAQLCCMYSYFRTKPALIKSALLAGAMKTQEMENYDSDTDPNNNIDSVTGNWRPALCRMNGAGMLNVTKSAALLYDSCYIYFPNFGGTNNPFTTEMEVENYSRMQICLSWLKKNTVTGAHQTGTVTDADKDTFILEVLDPQGELIYNSWYRYDTKEYIAFEPKVLGTYTIRVRKTNLLNTGTDFALCWY